MRVLAAAVLALLLLAAPAAAGERLDRAVQALRQDPVYVEPGADPGISAGEADALRDRIRSASAGPFYVAVLGREARDEAGGDPGEVLRQLIDGMGRRPGTYAAVAAGGFRAASSRLPAGRAGELATEAFRARSGDGVAAVLEDFVGRVAGARSGAGAPGTGVSGRDDGGGSSGAGLLVLLGVLGGGAALASVAAGRRRRREREAQVAELRQAARDDLVALGDDVRNVDLDVEMPGADPRAREELGRGLAAYEQAEAALERARAPEDFAHVSRTIDDGRQAMAACRALLDGREPPPRRPPCFFDPRHGPSVEDVAWAPDGYAARDVPVCAACAARLSEGLEPRPREVLVGGRPTPYWNAPGHFAPWAGGFFGGGSLFLPGLLAGTMLGGALSGPDVVYADPGDGGFGGGDFGGGDFGGGDFGGDFGGGDF